MSAEPAALSAAIAAGRPLHASCIARDGAGLLILGAAGSGKSGLALVLMALGARLVADDRTLVALRDGALWASCPPSIRGRIEARGIGILSAPAADAARLVAAVDLDRAETERLPPRRSLCLAGIPVPLILNGQGLYFAAGLYQLLAGERCD